MPLAGKHEYSHEHNVQAVANLQDVEDDVERIVVPMGSGFSAAGILEGLDRYDIDLPVLGVRVGIDVEDTLDEWGPADWRERPDFKMVDSDLAYEERPETTSIAGVPVDPIYEAKALPYVEPGDLFYIVATRETELPAEDDRAGITTGDHPDVPRDDSRPAPTWYDGDAANLTEVVDQNDAPQEYDFLFSCPPYHDLEVYTDLDEDLSNMDYDQFMQAYRSAIQQGVQHLKDNRFAAFVVSEVRDDAGYYRGFVSDTVQAFEDAGMHLYNDAVLVNTPGTLPVRVRNYFEKGRKLGRMHQNVLVFYKGDPDPSAVQEAIGHVQVPEAVMDRMNPTQNPTEEPEPDTESDE